MVLLVVRTDASARVFGWFTQTKERSKGGSLIKNPFKWNMKLERVRKSDKEKPDFLIVIDVLPLFPNVTLFGWLGAVGIWMVWGFHWSIWPCVVMGMLGYFWTADFFYLMIRLALKKVKYVGPIKRVKLSELIKEVIL